MPNFLRFASIVAALLMAPITGSAQNPVPGVQPVPQTVPPAAGLPQERTTVADPDRKIAAGDHVTVEIVEDRRAYLPRVVVVPMSGALKISPLSPVSVSGRTVVEAAAEIKERLERGYYQHATVRLAINRVSPNHAGWITVSGEVRVAGAQELFAGETLTLTEAILKAGGLDEWGDGRKVRLIRQKDGATESITVNVLALIKSGDVKNDPVLQDGDSIFVPKHMIGP